MSTRTSRLELADVVNRFRNKYTLKYPNMMPSHKKALSDISRCCTKALGGRRYRCDDCNRDFWLYHCCRNRSCPKCHATQTQQWIDRRRMELLPCDYFHVVATVPEQLRPIFLANQKYMYGLLMRLTAEVLKEICADSRHLGGVPGILSILHTWDGKLGYHPHVHMLVTGGGVTPDGDNWEPARGKYLLPVRLMSQRLASRFRKVLRAERPDLYARLTDDVWHREWVCYSKHYGQGNEAVLNYLARYVHRIAISNARILAMDATHVVFRYKDHKKNQWRTMRLEGVEFLRRFLMHVLPRGFHKVRYYGLWHPRHRPLLALARLHLQFQSSCQRAGRCTLADLILLVGVVLEEDFGNEPPSEAEPECVAFVPECPSCGGRQVRLREILTREGIP